MRFRATFVQENFSIFANVINALSRITKTIHATKEIHDSSRNLEIKLCPSYILIRYCNPLCFERVHAYAYFDTKELFSECLIESRHDNIIGISIDAQGFILSVKPGCKAYQTAVKLAKDEHSRYLSFQFFLLDNKAKCYKIYKNCLIELLPSRYAETLVPPPNSLTGCCIELRSLQSIRSVVEQMRHLGADHLTFKLLPCDDDDKNNHLNDVLNVSTSNQKIYDLQMSTDTDLSTQWVTNHRCVLHTFQESQQEDLFESTPNKHASHIDADIFSSQTYLIKNLHQLLQLGSALSYEFVLLKFISDQCLIVTFPLLRIQHAHVTCVTSNLSSAL
ncbi:uncharacterized protein LOC128882675 isoform X2 [Hylaeus volcanicus]|uniref:uncharacterized protein LOC128882675 isoform X2 n=1 Tax=Hylaeus volcanicus TaxID=313075 RepID=UPI0023B7B36D|nr:uncharacterized protein LOC128882675 isoform X2 [Hylaeus volcanicus]